MVVKGEVLKERKSRLDGGGVRESGFLGWLVKMPADTGRQKAQSHGTNRGCKSRHSMCDDEPLQKSWRTSTSGAARGSLAASCPGSAESNCEIILFAALSGSLHAGGLLCGSHMRPGFGSTRT